MHFASITITLPPIQYTHAPWSPSRIPAYTSHIHTDPHPDPASTCWVYCNNATASFFSKWPFPGYSQNPTFNEKYTFFNFVPPYNEAVVLRGTKISGKLGSQLQKVPGFYGRETKENPVSVLRKSVLEKNTGKRAITTGTLLKNQKN